MALLKSGLPTDYIDIWMEELHAGPPEQKRLTLYTAIFCVIFLGELGQQFNKTSAPEIDKNEVGRLVRILENMLKQT